MNALWKIVSRMPNESEMPTRVRRTEPDQYDLATFCVIDPKYKFARWNQWRLILLDGSTPQPEYYTATPEPGQTMLGAIMYMARLIVDFNGVVSATLFQEGVPVQSCTVGLHRRMPDLQWMIYVHQGSLERDTAEEEAAAAA